MTPFKFHAINMNLLHLLNDLFECFFDGQYRLIYLQELHFYIMETRTEMLIGWHQSSSFPPGEDPPKEKLTMLAQEFTKEFGFSEIKCLYFGSYNHNVSPDFTNL